MNKFKVGDQVRCIHGEGNLLQQSHIYVVTHCFDVECSTIRVEGNDYAWFTARFELVDPTIDEQIKELQDKIQVLEKRRQAEKLNEAIDVANVWMKAFDGTNRILQYKNYRFTMEYVHNV